VTQGDSGDHVTLIQGALLMLDNAQVSSDEEEQQLYGPNTAGAVLAYKRKRQIINFSYQTSADDIVGKMTIQSLDTEMLALEAGKFRLLLSFGVSLPPPVPKVAIVSQHHPLPAAWARQMVDFHKPNVMNFPSRTATPEDTVKGIKEAIAAAQGGLLIFAVGHGVQSKDLNPSGGGFDVADSDKMRIGGRGSFRDKDHKMFVDVFYDEKPPPGSPTPFSEKENDERTGATGAKKRLKHFSIYQDLAKAFVAGKLAGVVLLTCNVGRSLDFMKKVANQWQTTLIAYRDFTRYVGGFRRKKRRVVRAILEKDLGREKSRSPGTNTPFAEVMFPLSLTDMIVIKP
jgi:hypothetical protein